MKPQNVFVSVEDLYVTLPGMVLTLLIFCHQREKIFIIIPVLKQYVKFGVCVGGVGGGGGRGCYKVPK